MKSASPNRKHIGYNPASAAPGNQNLIVFSRRNSEYYKLAETLQTKRTGQDDDLAVVKDTLDRGASSADDNEDTEVREDTDQDNESRGRANHDIQPGIKLVVTT